MRKKRRENKTIYIINKYLGQGFNNIKKLKKTLFNFSNLYS